MSALSRLSLANRGLTALVAVIITAFGLISIPSLKQQLFPSLDFPIAIISAAYQGATPDVVEKQVTEPIENAIQGTPGLEKVTSTSREGSTMIQLQFEYGTDLDDAVAKMQTALNRIDAQLPAGVDPSVFAGSTDDVPAVVLAASGGASDADLAEKLQRLVLPEIQGIDGVREATVTGSRAQQIIITPIPRKTLGPGLDMAALANALRSNGVVVPAGALTADGKSLAVQVGTPLASLDDLRNLYLVPTMTAAAPAGPAASAGPAGPAASVRTPVRLGDVATVESQPAPQTSITRTNGKPSLGISVLVAAGGNAVGVSKDIRDRMPDLAAKLGTGATLTPVFDQAPYVEKSIKDLTTEGLLGLLMAVVVILIFLLSIRSTLVTAVSIPLSVIVALIALDVFDYSLNLLTLGALTIAIGRVVDDSIVVLENIKRHLGYGEDKNRAIITAVREVAGAVTASTLTTVAVFSPIALVGGLVGQLFSSFAVTVTVALLASLLVSLTIIPVLAYWFLKPANGGADEAAIRAQAEEKERSSWLQVLYVPVIRFATRRRLTVIIASFVIFLATGAAASLLKQNFFDNSGQNTLQVTQKMPIGTTLDATDTAAKKVEEILAGTDEVKTYQVNIGSGGGIFGLGGTTTKATFSITLKDGAGATAVQDSLRDRLDALTNAGEITVGAQEGGGFSASQLQVIVKAGDQATLTSATEQVRKAMTEVTDVKDVTSDLAASSPRLQVTVDRAAAAKAGLTEAAIGQTLASAFRGTPLGQLTMDGRQQSIMLNLGAAPATIDQVKAIKLPSAAGFIPLTDVASVETVDGPQQIVRIDGDRTVTVNGTATSSNLQATTTELKQKLDGLTMPAGASWTIGGASADQADAFGNLGLAMLAAIAIVFIIMAAAFRSLVQPLILLVSVPFAATGAILLLLVTGTALGVPAMIGMLMLIGIVVTNAIVLLDLINQYRAQGATVQDAVIEGGRRRLRPILMTAVATIFALLPMALGLTGSGGFISQPLAIVVIGGLLSSTLLTLVLVPTLYVMVEGRKERRAARRAAKEAPQIEEPEPALAAI